MAIEADRQRVEGIGGLFFRSDDPEGLSRWYEQRLGVTAPPGDYESEPWAQSAGATVFAPFPRDASMIGSEEQQWMVNFRVADLDAFVDQLREEGEEVEVDPADYPNGRFAVLRDPEGNGIQLWEPAPNS